MLIDLRVYTYLPGKFRTFLRGYEQTGFALTSRHLGRTLGIFTAESGVQNRTFQFFMYEGQAHRDQCRRGMLADPAWHTFVKIDSDALLQQMNTLLTPTEFSPVGGEATRAPVLVIEGATRLFELTTWTFRPDSFAEGLAFIGSHAQQVAAAGSPIGYFLPQTGTGAQLVRMTAYADAETRDNERAAAAVLLPDRHFQTSLRALIVHEDITLLRPTPYSPLR